MKKIVFSVSISVLIFSFLMISCSPKKNANSEYIIQGIEETTLPTQEELLEQVTAKDINASQNKADSKKSSGTQKSSIEKPDLDLTKMSATMIYAEVFNMLIEPENYIDKILKMKGNFQVFTNEQNTERYYAVVIQDATACCQQGIEFIWAGDHAYPQDYPKIGQEITVTGSYKVAYTQDDLEYHFLLADRVEW
ncbi:MAG: hypothetical protein K6A43_08740 [Treponema sp.]|nr:hypothetical protein [Treponema sp.]